ncbi:hypothetical protein G3I44_04145 [Halogeometricum borinquense]|uniref:Uncharacterized protein n=1 Tax=Halogeometricum borinquense TaxID=60847 RepID=A0A6C0UDU0_9EURY|nr:hypothetical protein [Halogeometricum borinquense]QIB73544.1 hypothetical protein G3I44_04145 [Halogeometricum borinquense]
MIELLKEYGPSSLIAFVSGVVAKVTGLFAGVFATIGTFPLVSPTLDFIAADGRFWLTVTTITTSYLDTPLSSGTETVLVATVATVVVVAKVHDKYLDYKDDD